MMTNKVTKAVFDLIGDRTPTGYALNVSAKEIPVYLNKDKVTEYPQIRVTPFIEKGDNKYQKYIDEKSKMYRHWQYGVFQVDIYSKKLTEAQNIYDVLSRRFFDFFNLETLVYDYNDEFETIDIDVYRTISYALLDDGLFKDIYGITIGETIFRRVQMLDDLIEDSFYVDDNFLYVKTSKDLHKIKIKVLMQGRLFPNGFSHSDNGIHAYAKTKERNLSSLESNEVERISFDLEILFSKVLNREELPKVDKFVYERVKAR